MDEITGFGWLSEILSSKLDSFQQEHHSENTVGAITHSLTLHQVMVLSNHTVLLRRMSMKEKWISTHGALCALALVGVEGGGVGNLQQLGAVWDGGFWIATPTHPSHFRAVRIPRAVKEREAWEGNKDILETAPFLVTNV